MLIGITGRKGHGKDTAGLALQKRNFAHLRFATILKEMTKTFLRCQAVDERTIDRMVDGDLKEVPTYFMEWKTPRQFQQALGTEFGRDCIGENVWVNATLRGARHYDDAYISDVRFPNEEDAIKARGGVTVRIERPGALYTTDEERASSKHISESQIDGLPVNHVVMNSGSVDDLHAALLGALGFGA